MTRYTEAYYASVGILSASHVATVLGLSKISVQRMMKWGQLKCLSENNVRKNRISAPDLLAYCKFHGIQVPEALRQSVRKFNRFYNPDMTLKGKKQLKDDEEYDPTIHLSPDEMEQELYPGQQPPELIKPDDGDPFFEMIHSTAAAPKKPETSLDQPRSKPAAPKYPHLPLGMRPSQMTPRPVTPPKLPVGVRPSQVNTI